MKINDGIYMLEIHSKVMDKESVVNLSVLCDKEKDNVVLIDTGLPNSLDKIQESFEKDNIPFKNLKSIILTHQDIDHVGNIYNILNCSDNKIQIFCHKEEEPYINGEKKPIKLAKLESKLEFLPDEAKVICSNLKAGFEKNKVSIDKTLTDGEILPYLNNVKVIYTPGHTPGHISLYLEDQKLLIAGDILMVKNDELTVAPENINSDNKLIMKSLEKLMNYDIKKVICYHGGLYDKSVNMRIRELCAMD